MKKVILSALLAAVCVAGIHAIEPQKSTVTVAVQQNGEKAAEIKFDTLSHDFGVFMEKDSPVKCVFNFTNVGNAPLIIHQAIASCGCTIPIYTKDPVKPGERGSIEVTYNGTGKYAGKFKKNITVRTNSKENSVIRLTIEGDMKTE